MNDDNHDHTQDSIQITDYGTESFTDVAEKLHDALSVLKKSVQAVVPDDVAKLKNPFTVEATSSYKPYRTVATPVYPDTAFAAVDEREQKIKNLEDEVAGLNYHLAEAKDRLQQIEYSHHMLQMEYVELKSKLELLEKMLRL